MPFLHRVEMGRGRPRFFDRCPWATVAADPATGDFVETYVTIRDTPILVPEATRADPQVLAAVRVIADELAQIDREEAERLRRDP